MKKLIFLFLMLFTLNVNAQIAGNDIIDPLFSSNPMCVYLKEFSNKMSLVIYNNYEDSTVYINDVYLMNEDNVLNKILINNNQIMNDIVFDIDEDQTYDIIVTTNKDSWKITFDKYSECYWHNMEICIFTNVKETSNKKNNEKIYNLDGILINNFNSKVYIYNGKKYIKL